MMVKLVFLLSLLSINILFSQEITTKIDTLNNDELILIQEVIIDCSVEKVWAAYTDENIWKEWVSPNVKIELETNGRILSHYDKNAKIGDEGTIEIKILFFIPYQKLLLQSKIPESFPRFIVENQENMYNLTEFIKISDSTTKIISYGIGYRKSEEWLNFMKTFIIANESSLLKLKRFLENN